MADVNIEKGEEAVENLTQEYGPGKVIFVKTNVTNKSEFESKRLLLLFLYISKYFVFL